MKVLRTLTYLFLFGSTLILGLHAGRTTAANLAPGRRDPTPEITPLPPTPEEARIPGNGQRNLLLIVVDSLTNPQPHLEAVWLVLYIKDFPQITLLPIYPQTTDKVNSGENLSLKENLLLSTGGSIDPRLVDALKARQIWWNAYIVVDRTALGELIRWTNQVQKYGGEVESMDDLPSAWKDPDGALVGQRELAQKICLGANVYSEDNNILKTMASLHFMTDLDLKEATDELQEILSHHQKLVCEFPTFSVSVKK